MNFLDFSFNDAAQEIGYDAALFHEMETTDAEDTLRFWECSRAAVVVGLLARIDRQVHEQVCEADGVPVVRRLSGGGAVVVGQGCLNSTLLLSLQAHPELRNVARSYPLALNRLVRALGIPGLLIGGSSDLALHGRKVSGCAQRRGRQTLLHHGTWLYDFDLELIPRYLKEPALRPTYRAGRSHLDFVANAPMKAEEFKARLKNLQFTIEN